MSSEESAEQPKEQSADTTEPPAPQEAPLNRAQRRAQEQHKGGTTASTPGMPRQGNFRGAAPRNNAGPGKNRLPRTGHK